MLLPSYENEAEYVNKKTNQHNKDTMFTGASFHLNELQVMIIYTQLSELLASSK